VQRIILLFTCVFALVFPSKGSPVSLSQKAEISVLTCGPSKEVHALYGHTAIRVNDPQRALDVIFNYGVFSFNAPNFVYRFAKGKTDYMLAAESYTDFYESYKRNGRSIDEQVLNFTHKEKQQLLDFLIENAKPENREYRYNFFHDNCATRVRDVVEKHADGTVVFPVENGQDKTFRKHVHEYQKVLPWVNFGIMLTLGSPSDQEASAYEEMFLPDFLMKHFAEAQIVNENEKRPLVKLTRSIYDSGKIEKPGFNPLSPFMILFVMLAIVVAISYRQFRKDKITDWIDYFLLFLTGLAGLVLLWFVTFSEHPAMHANYHLWWAVPTNLPFLFLWRVKRWRPVLKWYWHALSAWLILFFLFNFFIPQSYHIGFYLIALMLLCRALLNSFRKPFIKWNFIGGNKDRDEI
jgi:hypothetical protein